MEKLKLGDRARDDITGMTGTVTCRAAYLHGPDRLELTGADNDGRPMSIWELEERFRLVRGAGLTEAEMA